jgi:hypothetical protein
MEGECPSNKLYILIQVTKWCLAKNVNERDGIGFGGYECVRMFGV